MESQTSCFAAIDHFTLNGFGMQWAMTWKGGLFKGVLRSKESRGSLHGTTGPTTGLKQGVPFCWTPLDFGGHPLHQSRGLKKKKSLPKSRLG